MVDQAADRHQRRSSNSTGFKDRHVEDPAQHLSAYDVSIGRMHGEAEMTSDSQTFVSTGRQNGSSRTPFKHLTNL